MTVIKEGNLFKVKEISKEDGAGQSEVYVKTKERLSCEDLRKPLLMIAQSNGTIVSISADLQLKGMDSKLIQMINGRTGAYCYACDNSLENCHDIEKVLNGFYMNFGMGELEDAVKNLMSLHDVPATEWNEFEFPYKKGDYGVRFGLKHTPLTTSLDSTKVIAVLHTTKLRMFAFVNELII